MLLLCTHRAYIRYLYVFVYLVARYCDARGSSRATSAGYNYRLIWLVLAGVAPRALYCYC